MDLSGNYANCKNIGKREQVSVDRMTPDGVSIGGVIDWVQGGEAHINAVNGYIKTVIDNWMREGLHDSAVSKPRIPQNEFKSECMWSMCGINVEIKY